MFGVTDVTGTTLMAEMDTYGDVGVQRTHSGYDPAVADIVVNVTKTTDPEPVLDSDILGTVVGLVALGDEQDEAAMMNALESPDTLGIIEPLTATTCEEEVGIAIGLIDVAETIEGREYKKTKGKVDNLVELSCSCSNTMK